MVQLLWNTVLQFHTKLDTLLPYNLPTATVLLLPGTWARMKTVWSLGEQDGLYGLGW